MVPALGTTVAVARSCAKETLRTAYDRSRVHPLQHARDRLCQTRRDCQPPLQVRRRFTSRAFRSGSALSERRAFAVTATFRFDTRAVRHRRLLLRLSDEAS